MNTVAVDLLSTSVSLPIALGSSCLILALWPLFRRSARPLSGDVFFGVTVAPDWPDSVDGKSVLATYLQRVAILTAVVFTLSLVCALPHLRVMTWATVLIGSPLLQVIGTTAAYLAGRRAAQPHAVSSSTLYEASLETDESYPARRWALNQLGPVTLLVAAALVLYWRWPEIPMRLATRSNAAGQVTHWATKSVGGVFTPVADGLLTVAFIFILGVVTIDSGRRLRTAGRSRAIAFGPHRAFAENCAGARLVSALS